MDTFLLGPIRLTCEGGDYKIFHSAEVAVSLEFISSA